MTNLLNLNNFNSLQLTLIPSQFSDSESVSWSNEAPILVAEIADKLSLHLFFDYLRETSIKYQNYSEAIYFVEKHLTIFFAYDDTQASKGITMSLSVETLNYLTKAHLDCFQRTFDIFKQLQELRFLVSMEKLSLC